MAYEYPQQNAMAGSGSLSCITMSTPPAPESPLSQSLSGLVNTIAELEHAIGTLSRKLDPVICRTPDSTASNGAGNRVSRTAVLDTIDSSSARVNMLIQMVSGINRDLVV